jgi:hypothetical protein
MILVHWKSQADVPSVHTQLWTIIKQMVKLCMLFKEAAVRVPPQTKGIVQRAPSRPYTLPSECCLPLW